MAGDELQPGDAALVQLESGEIVTMEYLQPRKPESEADEDDSVATTGSAQEKTVSGVLGESSMNYDAKKAWIMNASFRELGDLYTPAGRSGLRAKRHLQALEVKWLGVENPRV